MTSSIQDCCKILPRTAVTKNVYYYLCFSVKLCLAAKYSRDFLSASDLKAKTLRHGNPKICK